MPGSLGDLRPDALNLNDLVWLEDKYGALDGIAWNRMTVLRDVLWLVMRHNDPSATPESVGEGLTLATLQSQAGSLLRASGLTGEGEAQGNAEAG